MNIQRRVLLKLFPTFFVPGLVSCAWTESNRKEYLEGLHRYRSYEEEVSSFMISKDSLNLVVITSSYHYIFEIPEKLALVTESDVRPKLTQGYSEFSVDDLDRMSGTITLYFVPRSTEEEKQGKKFGLYRVGSRPRLERSYRLVGKRYRASDIQLTAEQQLNNSFRIKIREPNPKFKESGRNSSRAQMSPIEQAANGLLLLVGLPLLIFTLSAHCMSNDDECLR